jgi:hypothetical protein
MKAILSISPRAAAFCPHFIDNGGNAVQAVIAVGYSPRSARAMAKFLLRDERVLGLLAALIRQGAPGSQRALERLMLPGRAMGCKARLRRMLESADMPAELVETDKGFVVVLNTTGNDRAATCLLPANSSAETNPSPATVSNNLSADC